MSSTQSVHGQDLGFLWGCFGFFFFLYVGPSYEQPPIKPRKTKFTQKQWDQAGGLLASFFPAQVIFTDWRV